MGRIVKFKKMAQRLNWYLRFRLSSLSVMVLIALIVTTTMHFLPEPTAPSAKRANQTISGVYFGMCNSLSRDDCVIDGDTFHFRGQRIRVADIDTPETHNAKCSYEAKLGAKATDRFKELLNAGPFSLVTSGHRDTDRYGRKLRLVIRDGQSIGAVLVSEGLARQWTGRRLPWCN